MLDGLGTELGIVGVGGWVAFLLKTVVYPWLKGRSSKKKEETTMQPIPGNPNDKPGQTEICRQNRDKIIRLITNTENQEKSIDELKRKVDRILTSLPRGAQ